MHFTKTFAVLVASAALAVSVSAGCGSSSNNTLPDDDSGATTDSSGMACTTGQVMCSNACTDTKKDHDNCGMCGTACKTGELCSLGTCAASCGGGTTQCGMTCTVTKNDPENCGMCGTKCKMGEFCSNGMCASTCGGGTTQCGNICADTKVDPSNCGMCGKACAQGEVCTNAQCASTCTMGQTQCGGGDGGAPYCANTQTDNANCGMCGNQCPQQQVCSSGQCSSTCTMNQTLCNGGDGGVPYCANLQSDNLNCGACGKQCGSLEVCSNGTCASNCAMGQTKCSVNNVNYCANLQTDNANCGQCGNVCGGGLACTAGVCKAAPISVLICYADVLTAAQDVQNGLKALGDFSKVDLTDCQAATPSLNTLKAYDAVLSWSNSTYNDTVTLGNNLGDYWDAGGHVVLAEFANSTTPWALQGKFGTIGNGYVLINPTGYGATNESGITIIDAQSPLMANVSTLKASSAFHSNGPIINGGFSVANWSPGGTTLVVRGVKNGRRLVELNFYPPSASYNAAYWTGDGYRLMRNALFYR